MTWQLRVAAVQMRSVGDLMTNLTACGALAAQAVAEGARLVVLPECFSFLGRGEGDKLAAAEVLDHRTGPVMTMLRDLATKHGIWLIGGGTPEVVAGDPKRTYNTAVVVDPSGNLVARYRKIHLFDVDIPPEVGTDEPNAGRRPGLGATLRESDATAAGEDLVVVDIEGAPIGLSICYDLRFPELYRRLVRDMGAQVVVVPSAFTAHTGAAHWHVLMRARAIENQVWVVAPAQWGKHNDKRESYGHSLIVDPWGVVVRERADGDAVLTATLDGAEVAKRRMQMPVGNHAVLWNRPVK
jgi:nitrilase